MKTDKYCPKCGRRLVEDGKPGKRTGWIICKRGHVWEWIINEFDKEILKEV